MTDQHFVVLFEHLKKLLKTVSTKQKPKILLGLSGGADSVFLFHLLLRTKHENMIDLATSHLNHQVRTDAQETTTFCQELSEANNIPFYTNTLDSYQKSLIDRGSFEDKARQARSLFFQEVFDQYPFDFIMLAHHADDQIESFFIKLIRGTTLDGIGGMQTITAKKIIRPLLYTKKEEIIAYLTAKKITWHHDYTNDSDLYLRNKIRSTLIPLLNELDPRSNNNIQRFQAHARQDSDFLLHETVRRLGLIKLPSENKYTKTKLLSEHPAMQQRMLTHLLFAHQYQGVVSEGIILEIIRFLLHTQDGEHTIKNIVLHKKKDLFWITQQ